MLNEPLPIMDKQRVLEIQEKPRLRYIKNQEEYQLHHNTAHEKFMRGNQNANRNFSLMNFTIENTSSIVGNNKGQNINQKQLQSLSPQKQQQKKQGNRNKQIGQRQQSNQLQQNQQQQDNAEKDKTAAAAIKNQNQQNGDELQWGEQDYQKDHECTLDTQTNRCKQCSSVMKYFYHSGEMLLLKPFSIYYVDYYQTFSRKMECHTLPKSKQKEFLIISYLPYMREWTYFVLDRPKYLGLEEFIYENGTNQQLSLNSPTFLSARESNQQINPSKDRLKMVRPTHHQHSQSQPSQQIKLSKRVPFSLNLQFPQVKPDKINSKYRSQSLHQSQIKTQDKDCPEIEIGQQQIETDFLSGKEDLTFDFETFSVLGNFESSNINFCTVDKKESKCQILLRSDTNTKGCLHWFMFTIKVNQLFRPKKNVKHVASNLSVKNKQIESNTNNKNELDQSFDKQWIVMDDDDDEEEDNHDQENQSKTVNFSILNNKRNGYLYREGMQIAIFDSTKEDKGWHRGGDNIYYYRSNVDHQFFQTNGERKNQTRSSFSTNVNGNTTSFNTNNQGISSSSTQPNINQQLQQTLIQPQIQPNSKRGFQTMDFSFTFTENGQRVTFAYCYPYTLTDLISYLEAQEQKLICSFLEYQNLDQDKKQLVIKTNKVIYKKRTIASSRIGLPIIMLKITSSKNPKLTKNKKKKKIIFIIARQHPGETPSSYACEGFISYLLQDTIQAKYLLENYIFKIVPMMNPDGVVIGNSRCNLSGSDLNRKWDNPDPILHPEVFEVKKEIKKSHLKREVAIFCDIHGHSMKKHAFFYGCNKTSDGGASTWTQVRLIPRILSKKCHLFSIKDCKFRVTEDKKNTARVICWNELKISNSFTLETSFFGQKYIKNKPLTNQLFIAIKIRYDDIQNEGKPTHFTIQDLMGLGKNLCESILEYTLVMEILNSELAESKGWLKPYRLVQVTGESAQNKIIRNMKEQKKQEKQKRIEANLNNIQQERERQQAQVQQSIRSKEKRSLTPNILNGSLKKGANMLSDYKDNNDDITRDGDQKIDSQMDFLSQLCPGMKKDWRDYFGKEELEKNFKKIERGEDPNELESVSGSDSEAEIDIFKENELLLSNEAKNRKKQKKKKQSIKKEKENNGTTIDAKANNDSESNNQNDSIKKKKPSTAYVSSMERNRWNPSPLIQNYKQQLEMKKQQLKKQSYPIAKVGQSFSSAYQQTNIENQSYSTPFQQQQQQIIINQGSPQQIQKCQQQFPQQPQAGPAKNSVNGAYLEKKLIEMQQVQQGQNGQNNGNVSFYSRNSQGMIFQTNTVYKQRKSVITQFEDSKTSKGIASSISEVNSGFRLNTSDMQSRLNDNQNIPNSNSSAGNYGKYSTSNSTQSSNLVQQTQFSTKKTNQNFYQSNQNDNLQQEQENNLTQEDPSVNKEQRDNNLSQKKSRANSVQINENKLKNSKAFIVDDDDDDEQAMSKYKSSIGMLDNLSQNILSQYTPNRRSTNNKNKLQVPEAEQFNHSQRRIQNSSRNLSKSDAVDTFEVQILSQKSNRQQFNSAGNAGNSQLKVVYGSYSEFSKKQVNSEQKGNNNNLQIPHNFVSASSSKQELQPFYFDEQIQSNYSNFNSNNIVYNQNNNFSSSNSDIMPNMEEFNQLLNNVDQTAFTKEISKNASNFDKKIRAQAPLRQLVNLDKQNSYQQGNETAFNSFAGISNINNPQQITNPNYARNSERLGNQPFKNAINNNNNLDNKKLGKKYRARSIQEGKVQLQNQQLTINNNQSTYSSNYEKIKTVSDDQKFQAHFQESGNTFIPFKNFSSYANSLQANNNIRIRKLNFI